MANLIWDRFGGAGSDKLSQADANADDVISELLSLLPSMSKKRDTTETRQGSKIDHE